MRLPSLRLLTAALAVTTCLALPLTPAFAKAAFGEWGVPLSDQDTSVKPGDDFYMFVNGGWDKRVEIPADRSSYSDGTDITEQALKDLHEIAEAAETAEAGTTLRKVGDFYASYMDEAAIEAKGIEPVKPLLAEIDSVKDRAALSRLFAKSNSSFGSAPISAAMWPDSKAPMKYAVFLQQSGLGLPDREYYLKDSEENLKYREAYKAYIEKLLSMAGIADPKAKMEAIYGLELEMAKLHWPVEDTRDTVKTYNPASAAQLNGMAPGIDWTAYIDGGQFANAPNFILLENTAIAGLARLVAATPLDTWKAYLTFHTIDQAAPFLTKAFDDAHFDFHGKTMDGRETQRDRWKRALALIDTYMGEALGEAYVAKRFPPEAKAEMAKMVGNLKTALGQMIDEAQWLDASTKTEAHKKLDTMEVMIGYPDAWRDYSGLDIQAGDSFGNVQRAMAFDWTRQTARIADPVDRKEWDMTAPTVNAYYWPEKNHMVFPAGILQPPYFDLSADMAVNYGATGATIGHEISHGFDDQGRKYDWTGAIRDWWTEKDGAAFDAEAKKMVEQFNAFEPLPGVHINGQLTLGENIADLAGIAIAYRAYKLALNGQEAPVLDGLTGDQRFFMGYALSWRSKEREDSLRADLASDPHSPPYYRVNGILNNFQPWYDAFGIGTDAKMYLAPEKRAKLW